MKYLALFVALLVFHAIVEFIRYARAGWIEKPQGDGIMGAIRSHARRLERD